MLFAAILTGCIHVKIEQTREVAGRVGSGESVVLLAKPQQKGINSESGFLDCLEEQLLGHSLTKGDTSAIPSGTQGRTFRVVPHQAFVDSLYPWLEPSTAILDGDFARTLVAHAPTKERLAATGVRYVVVVEGVTNVVDQNGSLSCVIGPGVGGCIGVAFWKKVSGYEAQIWDLDRGVSLGTVGTDVSGNSVFIGAIVPLPFIVPVQHTACTRMARELENFLAGKDP
jgi:hypothetical protein